MSEARVIKRYANRKLYDTQQSCYVTLEQIAELIRKGEDVKIVDNNSKEDLTSVTLAQIIFEEEKRKSFLPLPTMRSIIQSGGQQLQEYLTQAGTKVRSVFRRDKGEAGEGEDGAPIAGDASAAPSAAAAAGGEGHEAHTDGRKTVREFLERSQQTFDEWQKRVDDRIRHVVETLSPFAALQKELGQIQSRIADLEKKLGDGASDEH
jgi:polyhydroxyalkanoate synthesis repressor PhaR